MSSPLRLEAVTDSSKVDMSTLEHTKSARCAVQIRQIGFGKESGEKGTALRSGAVPESVDGARHVTLRPRNLRENGSGFQVSGSGVSGLGVSGRPVSGS